MTAPRRRHQWPPAEERFLIAARRERFGLNDIAYALRRTPQSVAMKAKRMEQSGVLLRHRKEELALLERLLAEAVAGEQFRGERE